MQRCCLLVTGGGPAEPVKGWKELPSQRATIRRCAGAFQTCRFSLNRCTSTSLRAKLSTDSPDQKEAILLNVNTQPQQKMA